MHGMTQFLTKMIVTCITGFRIFHDRLIKFIYTTRTARPKPIYLWTVQDVQKWLRRHCSEYFPLYAELFLNNEVTGRTLLRITEGTLLRLGISNMEHRQEVWREITKLRLKSDIVEIRDLERKDEN